ncbi:fasciclin domain-containing protein, partial [Aspergillus vadensis CBS 113365]
MKNPLWALVALPFTTALVFPFHHDALPEDDNSITIADKNIDSDLINGITTTLATALDHLTTDIWPTIVNNYLNYNPSDSPHLYAQHVSELAPPFRHPTPPPYLRHPASNKTLYDLILSNPDTSILAHFIRNDHHLTNLLNTTSTNLTFFAPTDEAIRKLYHHHHHEHNTNNNNIKKTHNQIHHILTYHTVKGSYPIDKLFHSHTIPTYIHTEHTTLPQRITIHPIITRDLMLNFHSRIISLDKHASNGILYHIDSVLMPPPSTLTIL